MVTFSVGPVQESPGSTGQAGLLRPAPCCLSIRLVQSQRKGLGDRGAEKNVNGSGEVVRRGLDLEVFPDKYRQICVRNKTAAAAAGNPSSFAGFFSIRSMCRP